MLYTNSFSKQDATRVILKTTGIKSNVLKIQKMKNGAFLIVFWDLASKKKLARFVSKNDLLRVKFERTIERARQVVFDPKGQTTTGYTATLSSCNCPAFQDVEQVLFVGGQKVCKHTLSYAKKFLGCQKLSDFMRLSA